MPSEFGGLAEATKAPQESIGSLLDTLSAEIEEAHQCFKQLTERISPVLSNDGQDKDGGATYTNNPGESDVLGYLIRLRSRVSNLTAEVNNVRYRVQL